MIEIKETIKNLPKSECDVKKQKWRLKLNKNENINSTPNFIISAIKNFDFEQVSLYPEDNNLIDKISEKYNQNTDEILLTNGSCEALEIISAVYLKKDDEILSYNPTCEVLSNCAAANEATYKTVEYKEKFKFDIETIENSITSKTKIFYCATPNDPTGDVARASELEILINKFKDVLFVVDCSYISYANNVTIEDYFDLIKKYENVIVIKSFSIDYALAGLRLGFVSARNDIINNLRKITNKYNVNSIASYCGCIALNNEQYYEEINAAVSEVREFLYKGLIEKGFTPYCSEGNFILCDFYDYTDFYYEKLKRNGVIVKRFPKESPISTCLRITVPKLGGAKYILELLNKKDVLIFNIDNVIVDSQDSLSAAIAQTYKYFVHREISKEEIIQVINRGEFIRGWDVVKYIMNARNIDANTKDIAGVFQNLYYNPGIKGRNYYIDEEKLLISKETFEELSRKYDMVIFTERYRFETDYILEKFEIDKFFYYFITAQDLPLNLFKPNPQGAFEILKHCPHKTMKYLGGCVNDIIAGNSAKIFTIGMINPNADKNILINNYKHLCANYILENTSDLINYLEENEQI